MVVAFHRNGSDRCLFVLDDCERYVYGSLVIVPFDLISNNGVGVTEFPIFKLQRSRGRLQARGLKYDAGFDRQPALEILARDSCVSGESNRTDTEQRTFDNRNHKPRG